MRRSNLTRVLALLSLVAAVSSCNDNGGDGTFTLALADATLNVSQGSKDTIGITLSRADFGQLITLTVDGLPTGVVATFLPKTVPGNSSAAGLELAVAGTATLGTSTITVRANAPGRTEQIATSNITIGLTGSYTLSSHDFPLTAAQSGGGSGAVRVNRLLGHADNVTLVATNVPTGVTASFAASPTSSIATALSFIVGAAVAPGSYPITVTGTAAGLPDQTTQVTLTVIAPPATMSFSLPFCTSSIPVWFAYQNEGYPWQMLAPVSGVFTFAATEKLAVAYTYVVNSAGVNETDLLIHYSTRTELAGITNRDCTGPKSLTGTVSGATTGQSARVAMGAAFATPTAASPGFTITGVADRVLDLVATMGTFGSTASNLQVTPDLLLLQRGLNPASASSLGTLDFAGQGFAPASSNLMTANLISGDAVNVANTFWTGTNTYGVIQAFQPSTATNTLFSMPSAKFLAGDVHELLVEANQPGFLAGRINVAYLGAIADRTETLAPALVSATTTAISSSPYARLRGQLPVQAEYPSATRFVFFQDGGSSADRLVYLFTSAAYLGATPAAIWDVTIPEFGSVAGLNVSWLPSTAFVAFQAEAYSSPGPLLFGGIPSIGDVVKIAYRVSTNGPLLRAGLSAPLRAPLNRDAGPRQYLRR